MSNNSSDSTSDSECEYDPKYQNGKIYKVVCLDTGRIYIGSTYLTLEERHNLHKSNYNRYVNGNYHYKTCFDIMKDGNYAIELISDFPCNNKTELEREEGLHQKEAIFNDDIDCVNKVIAGRTKEEKSARKRDKFNCPCSSTYTRANKARHFNTKKHQKYLKEKVVVEKMMREIITEIVNNVINHL